MGISSSKPKSKVRKAIKIILIAAVVVYLLIEHFTLSPQRCLSKERVWRAEEMDLTIYVAEDYETKLSECFSLSDRDELNKYVMGKMIIDGELYPFIFYGEDHFHWVRFGNNPPPGNNEPTPVFDGAWDVTGEFDLVFNKKRIKFSIMDNYGDIFPKSIKKITFVPAYE